MRYPFEEGTRIRSRRTFDLDGCEVDGSIVYVEDWDDAPCIHYNQEFEIISFSGGYVRLQNLDERAFWRECEIDEVDLDSFELSY